MGPSPKAEWKPPPKYKSALAKTRDAQKLKEKKEKNAKGKKASVSAVGQSNDDNYSAGDDDDTYSQHTEKLIAARQGAARKFNKILELHRSRLSINVRVLMNSKTVILKFARLIQLVKQCARSLTYLYLYNYLFSV